MQLSPAGRTLIKGFEGYSAKAYRDAHGYSIGYGHFIGTDPSLAGRVITRAEADALFDEDVRKFERAVAAVTPFAQQHEFDAMTSLAYNIGTGNVAARKDGFAGSTVAKQHNLGNTAAAADAFLLWNKSEGKVNPVLVKRRAAERAYYLGQGGSSTPSFPTPPPQQSGPPPIPPVATAPTLPSTSETDAWHQAALPSGWGQAPVTSASAPTTAGKPAVITLAALAVAWLLYRLAH